MNNATVSVQIPATLLQFGLDESDIQQRVSEWLVLSLFADGHITSGKGASLLGLTRIEFLALLRRRGVAYLNYRPDELAEEFEAVEALTSGISALNDSDKT